MPYIIFFFKIKNCLKDDLFIRCVDRIGKCCITSAYLQWLCHSGERPVARGPLVWKKNGKKFLLPADQIFFQHVSGNTAIFFLCLTVMGKYIGIYFFSALMCLDSMYWINACICTDILSHKIRKRTFGRKHPANIQISLCICAV